MEQGESLFGKRFIFFAHNNARSIMMCWIVLPGVWMNIQTYD